MYTPRHFINSDFEQICGLIRSHPLGVLVAHSGTGFEVSHIPFILDTEGESAVRLRAHMPKKNPLYELISDLKNCVVVFQGAQGYVSPSWYKTKQEHGKVVPTWNYDVVHVHGMMSMKTDNDWLLKQLNDITNQSERNRSNSWAVSDAPEQFTERQMTALVGIEIEITDIEGKTKASQNQPIENRKSVLEALENEQPDSNFHKMVRNAIDSVS